MSAIKFPNNVKTDPMVRIPITTGKSLINTASKNNLPIPEIAKIDSPMTEPPINPGIDNPMIVIRGRSVFLRACP
jgi:hypothetical protein